jgi:hypothetical protein
MVLVVDIVHDTQNANEYMSCPLKFKADSTTGHRGPSRSGKTLPSPRLRFTVLGVLDCRTVGVGSLPSDGSMMRVVTSSMPPNRDYGT